MVAASGCGIKAPPGRSGGAIHLAIVIDRDANARNPEQIDQVIRFMQHDLHERLKSTGYDVENLADPAAFVPGPDRYLVLVHVVKYFAGSKAARMMIGVGAGALVLDTRNELYSGPGQLIFAIDGSVGSSRDWDKAAAKINQQIVAGLSSGRRSRPPCDVIDQRRRDEGRDAA